MRLSIDVYLSHQRSFLGTFPSLLPSPRLPQLEDATATFQSYLKCTSLPRIQCSQLTVCSNSLTILHIFKPDIQVIRVTSDHPLKEKMSTIFDTIVTRKWLTQTQRVINCTIYVPKRFLRIFRSVSRLISYSIAVRQSWIVLEQLIIAYSIPRRLRMIEAISSQASANTTTNRTCEKISLVSISLRLGTICSIISFTLSLMVGVNLVKLENPK